MNKARKDRKPRKERTLFYFVNLAKLDETHDIKRSTAASQYGDSVRQARAYLRKFRGLDLIEELYWAIPQNEWRYIATLSLPHTLSDLRGRPRPILFPAPAKPSRRRKRTPDPRQMTLFPK
jgi:hypothetical protein